jgi:hypothetical protein
MKTCNTCKSEKNLSEFHKHSRTKDGAYPDCKICTALKNKEWYTSNKERHAAMSANWYAKNKTRATQKQQDWHYRSNYGISYEDFLALAEKQNNKCLICAIDLTFTGKKQTRAVLDHDHDTGEIRGVLCSPCNTGIGLLKDSSNVLLSAYNYLKGIKSEQHENIVA